MILSVNYMTVREAASLWEITPRRVQVLCSEGKVDGAVFFGNAWAIPKDTQKPKDGRYKRNDLDKS